MEDFFLTSRIRSRDQLWCNHICRCIWAFMPGLGFYGSRDLSLTHQINCPYLYIILSLSHLSLYHYLYFSFTLSQRIYILFLFLLSFTFSLFLCLSISSSLFLLVVLWCLLVELEVGSSELFFKQGACMTRERMVGYLPEISFCSPPFILSPFQLWLLTDSLVSDGLKAFNCESTLIEPYRDDSKRKSLGDL